MQKRPEHLLTILAVLATPGLLLTRPARADEVTLKNGQTIRCLVVSDVCRLCDGTGMVRCPTCGGTGMLTSETVCPRCAGRLEVVCPACEGMGYPRGEITILARGGIRMTIPLSGVVKVERGGASEEEFLPPSKAYEKRLEKMDEHDAEAHFALAQWCLEVSLTEKAELHFLRSRQLDQKYASRVAGYLRKIQQAREQRIEETFRQALDDILLSRYTEALKALEGLVSTYPESGLLRARSRQKGIIEEKMGVEATRWGFTVDELISSLRQRRAILCTHCGGAGVVDCTTCNGTGDAVCGRCGGTGRLACANCNGTTRAVCPTCFGRGLVERSLGFATTISVTCTTCNGNGCVPCTVCGGRGNVRCQECQGRGFLRNSCPSCGGSGKTSCPECRGTGLRKPRTYAWGPYNVFPALARDQKPGPGRALAFQVRYKGALVTMVAEKYAYGGRLAAHLKRDLGPNLGYFLLYVDNTSGEEMISLGTEGKFVRMVSPAAQQEEMIPPAEILSKLPEAETDRKLRDVIMPCDVLPGALKRVLCVFPSGISSGLGYRVFFGETEVLEMDAVSVPAGALRIRDAGREESRAAAEGR